MIADKNYVYSFSTIKISPLYTQKMLFNLWFPVERTTSFTVFYLNTKLIPKFFCKFMNSNTQTRHLKNFHSPLSLSQMAILKYASSIRLITTASIILGRYPSHIGKPRNFRKLSHQSYNDNFWSSLHAQRFSPHLYLKRHDHDEEDGQQAERDHRDGDAISEDVPLPRRLRRLQTSGHRTGMQGALETHHNTSGHLVRATC